MHGLPTSCVAASNRRMPISESGNASTPLNAASSTLSTSNWRTTRQRLAPSETLTAISLARSAARASIKLATFRTSDQQDECNRTHQGPETISLIGPPVTPLVVGDDGRNEVLVGYSDSREPAARLWPELTSRLWDRHAVAQACDHGDCANLSALTAHDGRLRERKPDIGIWRELHALRHDADDSRQSIVDFDIAPNDRRLPTVACLPNAVAQDHAGRSALEVLVICERAAEDGGTPNSRNVLADMIAPA